ncbi:MAG: Amuc_1100 family pilus-like protein [Verrucomicrobiales bacterium]|nr:Amuc_1100 family pilus-like protein [Verrucomicrobiales bacterium]
MNYKVWLTVFGIVSVLLLGGAGFYAFSSYGKYSESLANWDSRVGTIEGLERRKPYPNSENAEALAKEVAEFQAAVDALFDGLTSFNRPLNTTLAATEFQQLVKNRIQDFRSFAQEGGLEMESPAEFQLGFNAYSNLIPPQELVPYLDYELEAIDDLLRTLVDSDVRQLMTFDRDPIPGEPGGEEAEQGAVVHKYPVRLRFKSSHGAFQDFINALANDKDFFYIVRVLKVKNDNLEGPIKLLAADPNESLPRYSNPETQEVAGIEKLQEWDYENISQNELDAKASEEGFVRSDQDARVLMGQEELTVFMVVDIVRFLKPEEVEASKESEKTSKGGRKR